MLAGSQLAGGQDFPPFGVLELEKGRGLKGQGRIGVNFGSEWREKQTMGFGYHYAARNLGENTCSFFQKQGIFRILQV